MGRYVTNDEVRAYVKSDRTVDDLIVSDAIAAAEQFLDTSTGRQLVVAGDTASARAYRPGSVNATHLWIHDCAEITSVVEDGLTLTANTQYVAEPLNGLTAAGEARPYSALARVDRYWYWDGPTPTVTVTARWGWTAIPDMAKTACIVAAKMYLDGRDLRSGLVGAADFGGITEREAKTVRDFISQYRGHGAWGIA